MLDGNFVSDIPQSPTLGSKQHPNQVLKLDMKPNINIWKPKRGKERKK
jgi:hypothetical protein